jgi:hypothetical protein
MLMGVGRQNERGRRKDHTTITVSSITLKGKQTKM